MTKTFIRFGSFGGIIPLTCLKPFPAKHAKHTKSMPVEATMLRTGGCPAFDGSKGFPFGRLARGTPPSAARPASSPAWTRPSGQPGTCAERSDAKGRPEGRRRKAWLSRRRLDGRPCGRASAGGRRDASLFRVFRVFRGKHHPTTLCCRKPRWQVNGIIPFFPKKSPSCSAPCGSA